MNSESIVTWNVQNLITVSLMAALAYFAAVTVSKIVKSRTQQS